MKCFRCGYCCINYAVIIVNDPEKGIVEGNLIFKDSGEKCPHLSFGGSKSVCNIHSYDWYKETPCYQFTQIGGTVCRIGQRELKCLLKTSKRKKNE